MSDPSPADLVELGTATLGESGAMILNGRIHAVWPGATLAAPCFTVRCADGDNLAVHAAVAAAPEGCALVVEVPADSERGFWGEVLTVAAQTRGIAGLVIDACVRDTAALEARSFPVFSTGVALAGATKHGPGEIGGSARVGDVTVESGDWVVADRDGVVVMASEQLTEVCERGVSRRDQEAVLFEQLQAGHTTTQLLGLDTGSVAGNIIELHHDPPP